MMNGVAHVLNRMLVVGGSISKQYLARFYFRFVWLQNIFIRGFQLH